MGPLKLVTSAAMLFLSTFSVASTAFAEGLKPTETVQAAGEETRSRMCSQTPPPPPDPETFVRGWISNPGSETCGHWQVNFSQLHGAIRRGQLEKRYVTFRDPWHAPKVKPGIGDHLLGMVSAFLVALLTDRAFIVEDSALTEFVEVAEVDWKMREDVPRDDAAVEVSYLNYGKSWKRSVVFPSDILGHFRAIHGAENIRITTNGGVLARIFSDTTSETYQALHSLGLRMPSAFACILRFLIKPKEEVWRPILPQVGPLLDPNTSSICIHMRTADRFAWKRGHTNVRLEHVWDVVESKILACAKDVEEFSVPDMHKTVWLFLSDSLELRKRVQAQYPDLVIPTAIEPVHPRFVGKQAMGGVLSEWLLFSMCDFYVINECGFSKTSAAFNLKRPRMFLFDHFLFGGAQGKCDQAKPSSLLDFHRWSGL